MRSATPRPAHARRRRGAARPQDVLLGRGDRARALITARDGDGSSQMLLVPMDRVAARIDRDSWDPLGMLESDSFAVDFTGVRLDANDLIGAVGDYDRQPWFGAGAARFVAVQAGAVARLADELAAFTVHRAMGEDAVQIARLGECAVAAHTAAQWVVACAQAWSAWDAQPDAQRERALQVTVDAARAGCSHPNRSHRWCATCACT